MLRKVPTKQLYLQLRRIHQKVEWRRLKCNNAASSKWIFNLFLGHSGRLLTKERLAKWACVDHDKCSPCPHANVSLLCSSLEQDTSVATDSWTGSGVARGDGMEKY